MDRAPKWDIVDAILYVMRQVVSKGLSYRTAPTGTQVHRYHVQWSKDGTCKRAAERLIEMVRENKGRDPDPSAGVVDA